MKCFVEKIIKYPVLLILIMLLCVSQTAKCEGIMLQQQISKKLLRFHVRANSDSEADQGLKLMVRDEIIEYLAPYFDSVDNVRDSKLILLQHMEGVVNAARKVVIDNGYDYDVKAYLTKEYFPLRRYGDVVLPPGEYEAFRVDIGASEGRNWWCVLYPAMCFVETTHAVYDEDELKNVFTQEELDYITEDKVEFKYFTFLNKYFE